MNIIGIYKIENQRNGKQYIGSSNNVNKRLTEHRRVLKNGIHHSIKLQRAVNKYGIENFTFCLLEECTEGDLLKQEQRYFDLFKPEYNILKIAGSRKGFNHSDMTKALIKKKRQNQVMGPCSELTKKKISEANKERVFTDEHKDKLSKAHKGKVLSEDHKEKIRGVSDRERMREMQKLSVKKRLEKGSYFMNIKTKEAIRKANMKIVIGFDNSGKEIYRFDSLIKTREFLNISVSTFWRKIKNNKQINNLTWKIIKDSVPSSPLTT